MKLKLRFLLLIIFAGSNAFSQIQYSGSINLEGYYSNQDELPFWFYSNQRGRVSEETNVTGWINGKLDYEISQNSSIELGGGLLYQDAYDDEISIDELYANFTYKWLQIVAGRKQKEKYYNGLSATNENFAWSSNHRPLPGIQIKSSRPIYFNENKKLGFEFSWEEYLMGNDRFVEGARLHSKSLYLVYNFTDNWHLKGGIRHFAQWGGDSPESGPQPEGFTDYLRIIGGKEGGENARGGDRQNALGNHLGTYELYLTKKFDDFSLKFIYNHFFEDGTGSRYVNFPDGRYGIFYENREENSLINSAIYELYYTKNQSINSSGPHKNDYYFNNVLTYHSGWTYQRRIIGVPFFDYSQEEDQVIGNRFLAHHLGISGVLGNSDKNFPFKLLASYIKKYGSHFKKYDPTRDELYLNYEMGLFKKPFNLNLILGTDYSNIAKPKYAIGLHLSKNF